MTVADPGAATAAPFPLVTHGLAADLHVHPGDDVAVTRVAADLAADIERVSGARPGVRNTTTGLSRTAVLIGTLGDSPVIDDLVAAGRLDVEGVAGRWEASVTQVVEAPLPGLDRALVIAGSDRRGTVYGVYDLSERIGVPPCSWWTDVPTERQDTVTVDPATVHRREPAIRYRGIALDGDDPAGRVHRGREGDRPCAPVAYPRIFELMLRLKANYVAPAPEGGPDGYADIARLADRYGIVVGSDRDPLADPDAAAHPDTRAGTGGPGGAPRSPASVASDGSRPGNDHAVNPDTVSPYWRDRAGANDADDSAWRRGGRGRRDPARVTARATTTAERVTVLNRVLDGRRRSRTDAVNRNLADVPRVFVPYRQVLDRYRADAPAPARSPRARPDGRVAPQSTAAGPHRAGGDGLHLRLLDTTPLPDIWRALRRAYDQRNRRTWIVDVGDLTSRAGGAAFAIALAWEIDRYGPERLDAFLAEWAGRRFGRLHAREIAGIRRRYDGLAATRRSGPADGGPPAPDHGTDEADHRLTEYRDLLTRVEALGADVLPAYRDAFFQLLEYPVRHAYLTDLATYWADRDAPTDPAAATPGAHLTERARSELDDLTRRYRALVPGGGGSGSVDR